MKLTSEVPFEIRVMQAGGRKSNYCTLETRIPGYTDWERTPVRYGEIAIALVKGSYESQTN